MNTEDLVMILENEHTRYEIGDDGRNLQFIDKHTGVDYCLHDEARSCCRARKGQTEYFASEVSYSGNRMVVSFGSSGISVTIKATEQKHYFLLEVLSINDEQVEELAFLDLRLTLKGALEEPFSVCALALNLQTNVSELPGAANHATAMCYPRFGFVGARVALIGCPQSKLRSIMQEVVSNAEELPHSPIGGPWALDAPINRGSYLFNFGNVTETTVDDWIRLANDLGFTQLDFHGGSSFRFGDCLPNPEMYPQGKASLKAVIDKLHAAGIAAGLHTYAFFMDKRCPWVTPVPDQRLGKDATFTLAKALTPAAAGVPVVESIKDMSILTGFFVRNSVTLRIDDELITYSGITRNSPCVFTGCERGAYGTTVSTHSKGAEVHHLKECFGLFAPDGDSTLLAEVAAASADTFNECGFDMIYLDALDGEDILGGKENGWHYGSKFVFELWQRLSRPALMEMSTFHHHLWYVRSRIGAWDHPVRSHKKFIDDHCEANEHSRLMYLPGHLGWWAAKPWTGAQGERTFPDDFEYLCCKCIGNDVGFSLMGIEPAGVSDAPVYAKLIDITKQYETLRHANYFPESIKAKLKIPGNEFTLIQSASGEWGFKPVEYAKHKVEKLDDRSNMWLAQNKFGPQPLQLRIEALMAAAPYDAEQNVTLADFFEPADFLEREAESGVTVNLEASSEIVRTGPVSGCLRASNSRTNRRGAWTKVGKIFSPPLDLSLHEQDASSNKQTQGEAYTLMENLGSQDREGLGVWIYGDCKGEVLNLQVRSPEHVTTAISEHYVIVDFTGWRYFELIEPEGERYSNYSWPYGGAYSIYRESIKYEQIESLGLWYNDLPPNDSVTCYLSPIKALPLIKTSLRNPTLTAGDKTIVFPTEIESGSYLEFRSMSDCNVHGPKGELMRKVEPQGQVPVLDHGANHVRFTCDDPGQINPRAYVTIITEGERLGSKQ